MFGGRRSILESAHGSANWRLQVLCLPALPSYPALPFPAFSYAYNRCLSPCRRAQEGNCSDCPCVAARALLSRGHFDSLIEATFKPWMLVSTTFCIDCFRQYRDWGSAAKAFNQSRRHFYATLSALVANPWLQSPSLCTAANSIYTG